MATPFEDFLSPLKDGVIPIMPVNHIANLKFLDLFLKEHTISNDYLGQCEIFGRDYLYIFYGRPSFKLNDFTAYPICFVFRKPVSDPVKGFPFDSGAFVYGKMDEYFDKKTTTLNDFEISGDDNNLVKLIEYFFVNNERYYNEEAQKTLTLSTTCQYVAGYYKMITEAATVKLDDRRSALELIYDIPFDLNNGLLQLVVLPEVEFNIDGKDFEYTDLKTDLIARYNCKVESYDLKTTDPIISSYAEIKKIVHRHLEKAF
jgi:hypothetical protein